MLTIKVKGQAVPKLESKQTDGVTDGHDRSLYRTGYTRSVTGDLTFFRPHRMHEEQRCGLLLQK